MADRRYELSLDLRDVFVWLISRHVDKAFGICVDRNYSAEPGVLSHVVVGCEDQATRRMLREEATEALQALGYTVAPTGGDVYDTCPAYRHEMSAHQQLSSIRRVYDAMHGKYAPARDYSRPRPTDEEIAALPFDDAF
ncbi:hypothetical protein [Pseudooceanicola onchidii]|uniref:hypothetical protein n=1 Tax=Pseudooceanicola onchidii TaxID=2562279 RepID=UPI0010AA9DDB|nr:hypothetical protein [Pseudooceanicola onchidii]